MIRQFVSFYLGNGLFGVDVLGVREIGRDFRITPVSPAPDFVAGLINLRGQTIAVADLGIRLGLGKRDTTARTRCVVLKTRTETQTIAAPYGCGSDELPLDTVGFLVDEVADLVTVDDSGILPPPSNTASVDMEYMSGVVRLEHELMTILHIGRVVSVR